jgi:hypothetical protein
MSAFHLSAGMNSTFIMNPSDVQSTFVLWRGVDSIFTMSGYGLYLHQHAQPSVQRSSAPLGPVARLASAEHGTAALLLPASGSSQSPS